MSLLIGLTEQRYISTVDTPYPGYSVQIPLPGSPKKIHHKVFAGDVHSLGHYFEAAVAWRDVTYLTLYGKPIPERIFHARQKRDAGTIPGGRHVVKTVRKMAKGQFNNSEAIGFRAINCCDFRALSLK